MDKTALTKLSADLAQLSNDDIGAFERNLASDAAHAIDTLTGLLEIAQQRAQQLEAKLYGIALMLRP